MFFIFIIFYLNSLHETKNRSIHDSYSWSKVFRSRFWGPPWRWGRDCSPTSPLVNTALPLLWMLPVRVRLYWPILAAIARTICGLEHVSW